MCDNNDVYNLAPGSSVSKGAHGRSRQESSSGNDGVQDEEDGEDDCEDKNVVECEVQQKEEKISETKAWLGVILKKRLTSGIANRLCATRHIP